MGTPEKSMPRMAVDLYSLFGWSSNVVSVPPNGLEIRMPARQHMICLEFWSATIQHRLYTHAMWRANCSSNPQYTYKRMFLLFVAASWTTHESFGGWFRQNPQTPWHTCNVQGSLLAVIPTRIKTRLSSLPTALGQHSSRLVVEAATIHHRLHTHAMWRASCSPHTQTPI